MKRYILISLILSVFYMDAFSQRLTLDSCKIYALENNKRLKDAKLQFEASKQVEKNAFTNYFPKIDAGVVAMKSSKSLIEANIPEMDLPVYDGNPANLASATQFTYFPGMSLELLDYANAGFVTAIQPLYTGGRIKNGNKLATMGAEFSKHNLNLTTQEIIVKTEEYYWTVVALEEKQKTLKSYEKLLNSLLADVSVSYDAGLIQKSDLLKVQLELNQVEANKLQLENGIDLLKMTLAQHLGIPYSEELSFVDTIIGINSPETLYNDPRESLQKRDEYKMLNKAIDAEILQKKMVRGEYMPQLAVGVSGLYLDVLENQNSYGIAFATLSIPISGWWGGSYKIQEHKIKVEIAQNNLDEKSELLLLQIDKTYKDLSEAYKQIQVAESSVNQTSEHLKIVTDNYNAGVVSTSDLLEAQAIYQKAQDAMVDAKTSYKIKEAYYLQTTAKIQF